ncbi:MAG: hypothetical protein K1X83_07150 [Oligoflexia bacterium]|nr:hypothetical protein [Oligoflexia bacterium]
MTVRLPWSQIKNLFDEQWVELEDVVWDWDRPYPRLARVRNFASDRSSLFHRLSGHPDAIILYTGGAEVVIEHDARGMSL